MHLVVERGKLLKIRSARWAWAGIVIWNLNITCTESKKHAQLGEREQLSLSEGEAGSTRVSIKLKLFLQSASASNCRARACAHHTRTLKRRCTHGLVLRLVISFLRVSYETKC